MILQKHCNNFPFSFFSDVIRANYGRFSITICNQHGNTDWKVDCQAGRTLRAMQARCSNKNQCIVPCRAQFLATYAWVLINTLRFTMHEEKVCSVYLYLGFTELLLVKE